MKFSLRLLFTLGVLYAAPLIRADTIWSSTADHAQRTHGFSTQNPFWNEPDSSNHNFEGRADRGFEDRFARADAAIDGFSIDKSFDFSQFHSSVKPELSFAEWGQGQGWDGKTGDFNGKWGNYHDGDRGDPGTPTVPTPEPESLWLFLTGMTVIGLCALMRRTMPTILSKT